MANLSPVMPGDRLTLPSAATTNALRATAREVGIMRNRQADYIPKTDTSVMLVRNTTGYDLPFLAIVGLESPVLDPSASAQNQRFLLNHLVQEIAWPPRNEHRGRFAVLLNGLRVNDYGPARFCDQQLVTVEDTVRVGQFVDVTEDRRADENILSRVPGGSAKVLWTGPMRDTFGVSESRAGSGSVNELQRVALGYCSGGTFTLTFDDTGSNPQVTGDLDWDISNADLEAALEGLSNIGDVAVTGGPLPKFPVAIEFKGSHSLTNVRLMTIDGENLTGLPHWAIVRLCSDQAEVIQGVVVEDFVNASGPLAGGVCFTMRPIRDKGIFTGTIFVSVEDVGSPTGFTWTLAYNECSFVPSDGDWIAEHGYPQAVDQLSFKKCAGDVCTNDRIPLVTYQNSLDRLTDPDADEWPPETFDEHCVNRSVDARASAGTYVRVSGTDGEFGIEFLDCRASDEGIEMLIGSTFGGMGGFPMGDGSGG